MVVMLVAWYYSSTPPRVAVTYHRNYQTQKYQWSRASDVGDRANAIFGDDPEPWNFTAHRAADLVIINLGTNDGGPPNNIPGNEFYKNYVEMVEEVHRGWPNAQIVLMVCPVPTFTYEL
jgi:hypothetical protein